MDLSILVLKRLEDIKLYFDFCNSHIKSFELHNLYFTDQTFNIFSFTFLSYFSYYDPRKILIDHLKVDNLTYQKGWRFITKRNLKLLIKFPFKFQSIKFSNGEKGYSLKIIYDEVIHTTSLKSDYKVNINFDVKYIFLFPPSHENIILFKDVVKYYLELFEKLPKLAKSSVLFKFHPREQLDDSFLMNLFNVPIDQIVKYYIPAEFLHLERVEVFNCNSGVYVEESNVVNNVFHSIN
jgi:hypothetical protein